MNDEPQTLRDLALRASDRHGGARGRALGRVAEREGVKLVYTTVDKIIGGTYRSKPSRQTVQALAKLAGVSDEVAFRAAGVPLPQASFAEQLPPDADLLTPLQREAVLAVVRQFAAANEALHEREAVMGNAEHPAPTKLRSVPTDEEDLTGPYDEDLDALPPEADDPAPIRGVREADAAARKKGDKP